MEPPERDHANDALEHAPERRRLDIVVVRPFSSIPKQAAVPRISPRPPLQDASRTPAGNIKNTENTSFSSSTPIRTRLHRHRRLPLPRSSSRLSRRRSPEEERRRRTVPTEAAAIQASEISSYSLVSLLDLLGNTCMDASSKIKAPRQHAVTAHVYLPLTLTIGATPMSPSQQN
uniref:Uncharacterized protein n=2 Tax=Oryza sativa subsp. japonica TaxID=39947 RepID=Q75IW6_ORYSJ|nr:hypothetical protein [Oryza sativa Japonica Group]ABF96613.1 hypothetical protein LOC_Os03g30210 [Oryza sativa Japonica Group]